MSLLDRLIRLPYMQMQPLRLVCAVQQAACSDLLAMTSGRDKQLCTSVVADWVAYDRRLDPLVVSLVKGPRGPAAQGTAAAC